MFNSKKQTKEIVAASTGDLDIARVFLDRFTKRVESAEASVRAFGEEVGRMRDSSERSKISDLVLLERIQRTEALLEESLGWIKRVAELVERHTSAPGPSRVTLPGLTPGPIQVEARTVPIVSPSGVSGSLSAITTPTQMQVLSLLADKGSLGAPEIGRLIGRSREHTARLMKQLYQEGYVKREQNRIPFRYSLVDRVRQSFAPPDSAPPTIGVPREGDTVVARPQSEEAAALAKPPPA